MTGMYLLDIRYRQNTCHYRLREDYRSPRWRQHRPSATAPANAMYVSEFESIPVRMETASHASFSGKLRRPLKFDCTLSAEQVCNGYHAG